MNDGMINDGFTFVYSSLVSPDISPGTVARAAGKEYRFVQNGATTATAAYPCVYVSNSPDTGDYDITADVSNGIALGAFAGVLMAGLGPYEYGWVMRDGMYHTCTLDAAVTAGNGVVVDTGSTDGSFSPAASAGLVALAGIVLEGVTAAATGVSVWIKGL